MKIEALVLLLQLLLIFPGAALAQKKTQTKANEGHGFSNEENRFEFYRAMEEFLGKHIGGRVEKEMSKN
jgi:hypothetical protein